MKRITLALVSLFVLCVSALAVDRDHGLADTWFDGSSEQFSLDFVTIDDPGNPAKTGTGNAWDPGSVPYTFKIAKYETPWFAAKRWLNHANVYSVMKSGVAEVSSSNPLGISSADSDNRPVVHNIHIVTGKQIGRAHV